MPSLDCITVESSSRRRAIANKHMSLISFWKLILNCFHSFGVFVSVRCCWFDWWFLVVVFPLVLMIVTAICHTLGTGPRLRIDDWVVNYGLIIRLALPSAFGVDEQFRPNGIDPAAMINLVEQTNPCDRLIHDSLRFESTKEIKKLTQRQRRWRSTTRTWKTKNMR